MPSMDAGDQPMRDHVDQTWVNSFRTFAADMRDRHDVDGATTEVVSAAMLQDSLETLVRLIERVAPGMRGSVLLLDDDGVTLRHGAAPNLPADYCRAIDGARIGPAAGSCGTAAYRHERVIVRDIATDPLWASYRTLAEPYGLAACWSTPILETNGRVLGTFAMYYDEPKDPTPTDIALTETATLLAKNVIKRARAANALKSRTETAERLAHALRESEEKFHQLEAALDAALADARQANKAKADFLAMMSHELRTPLNEIGSYAVLMLDGIPSPVTEGQQEYLNRIATSQQHLLGLVERVLTQAGVEAGL